MQNVTVAQKVKAQVEAHIKAATSKKQVRNKVTLVKVAASSSTNAAGERVQKRNTNLDTRSIAVFVSEKLQQCWLGTHIGFATKTTEGAINIMRNAPQKALQQLQQADDIVVTIEHKDIQVGPQLEALKQQTFDKYAAMGYTMQCKRATIKVDVKEVAIA